MCTSSEARVEKVKSAGFTALEVIMAMALTVVLAASAAPLVLSLERASVSAADRTVAVAQGRVAVARLENDLRLATSRDCRFPSEGPILQATSAQVVFLGHMGTTAGLCLIEWEISGSSLMRRWGPCPAVKPGVIAHSLFVDNKSMLEGLSGDAHFSYVNKGAKAEGRVAESDLGWVDAVVLSAGGQDPQGVWRTKVSATARVSR